MLTNLIKARGGDPNEALGAIYAEAAPNSNIFKVARLLEAAHRAWFRAQKLLTALQKERIAAQQDVAQPANETENWLRSAKTPNPEPTAPAPAPKPERPPYFIG